LEERAADINTHQRHAVRMEFLRGVNCSQPEVTTMAKHSRENGADLFAIPFALLRIQRRSRRSSPGSLLMTPGTSQSRAVLSLKAIATVDRPG
jgi:hypothetical protein